MPSIRVYDPPGSCSSGVCGPEVNDSMSKFAAALDWAEKQGIEVERYNLGHQPGAFVENTTVRDTIESDGMDCLPLVMAGDKIISKGLYLSKKDLAEKSGFEGLGASVKASGCAPKSSCCG